MTVKMRVPGFTAAAMEKVETIFSLCRMVFRQSTEFMEGDLDGKDVLLCDGEYTVIIRKATAEEIGEQKANSKDVGERSKPDKDG